MYSQIGIWLTATMPYIRTEDGHVRESIINNIHRADIRA